MAGWNKGIILGTRLFSFLKLGLIDKHVIIVSALGPNPFFFFFGGTFIQLLGLFGQGLGLGLGPGLDNNFTV